MFTAFTATSRQQHDRHLRVRHQKSRIVIRTNFVGHKKEKESKKKWLNKNISLFLSSQRDSAAKSTKPIAQETKVSPPNPNTGTSPSPSPVQTGEKPKPSSVVAQESLDSHRSSGDRKFDLLGAQNPVNWGGGLGWGYRKYPVSDI